MARVEEKRLTRVVLETSDGKVRYLEGDDAQRWDDIMHSIVMSAFIRGEGNQKELAALHWLKATACALYPKLARSPRRRQ
jgi:hypothetical protein